MRQLNLEPYSRAVFAWGLKARKAEDDGEEYEEGETMEDILQRVEGRDGEVPRYPLVPGYDDPYVPDVQE